MASDPRERAEQRTLLLAPGEAPRELPTGQRVQEFVLEQVLAVGDYSIVYRAQDTRLERRVAIKEHMPVTLARRSAEQQVQPRLPRFAELYERGLKSFITEARLLGSFDHPALVKVHRFWADNGTAYLAMPYYEGITLEEWLHQQHAPPSERWLRHLAGMLIDALAVMHEQRCFHRNVAPDNVLMLHSSLDGRPAALPNPRPVLLDFGAARRLIGDATQNITAVVRSGYSPVEQYEGQAGLRQGAWTDVYALCALLYKSAFGQAPPPSTARLSRDEMLAARWAGQGRYDDVFLAAIDAGLAVHPRDRPRDLAALRALLQASEAPPMPPAPTGAALKARLPIAAVDIGLEAPLARSRPRWLLPAAFVAAALLIALLAAAALRR